MKHNNPRIIDLDILTYNDFIIDTKNLKIQHPKLLERKFVILPMKEIDPNYEFQNKENWRKKNVMRLIKDKHIGGLVTYTGSVHGTFYNLKEFQEASNIPLFIAADYERGIGQFLDDGTLFSAFNNRKSLEKALLLVENIFRVMVILIQIAIQVYLLLIKKLKIYLKKNYCHLRMPVLKGFDL